MVMYGSLRMLCPHTRWCNWVSFKHFFACSLLWTNYTVLSDKNVIVKSWRCLCHSSIPHQIFLNKPNPFCFFLFFRCMLLPFLFLSQPFFVILFNCTEIPGLSEQLWYRYDCEIVCTRASCSHQLASVNNTQRPDPTDVRPRVINHRPVAILSLMLMTDDLCNVGLLLFPSVWGKSGGTVLNEK